MFKNCTGKWAVWASRCVWPNTFTDANKIDCNATWRAKVNYTLLYFLCMQVGCDNVHIHCEATDVDHVLKSYTDGGVDLQVAKSCLQQKCVKQSDGGYINA